MENDPKEMELDFRADSCVDGETNTGSSENEVFAAGYGNAGYDLFQDVDNAPEVRPDAAESTICDAPAEAAAVEYAERIPAADSNPDMLRSRQPMNRPAGTPPLANNSGGEKISAMELAIIGKSYGAALRILREQHQVSYKELEQATLIQPHYLEALENENLSALPPMAYVIAFIRSLCSFYKLSSETGNQMVAKLKEQLEYTCNDELMNSLDVDATGLEVNERRIKRIIWGGSGILVLIAAVIVIIVMLVNSSSKPKITVVDKPSGQQEHFDPNTIYPLLEPPTLDLPKLPVAE